MPSLDHRLKRPRVGKRLASRIEHTGDINARSWRRWSHGYLGRHPLCVVCMAHGLTTPATEVDHIVPRSQGGSMWDDGNLQALCKSCHTVKTNAEMAVYRKGTG